MVRDVVQVVTQATSGLSLGNDSLKEEKSCYKMLKDFDPLSRGNKESSECGEILMRRRVLQLGSSCYVLTSCLIRSISYPSHRWPMSVAFMTAGRRQQNRTSWQLTKDILCKVRSPLLDARIKHKLRKTPSTVCMHKSPIENTLTGRYQDTGRGNLALDGLVSLLSSSLPLIVIYVTLGH